MGGIIKEILSDKDTLFWLGLIGVLLILFYIIYLLSTIGGRQSSYISKGNKTNNGIRRYYEPQNVPKQRGGESALDNHNTYSNHFPNKQNDNPPKEKDSVSPSEKDSDNGEENSSIHHTLNDDGTFTTEVFFDSTNENLAPVPSSPKYEYLETANNGQFRKLLSSDEKSFFRTWEENGTRKFEFHGNVDKALANINAIFDDVCEIEGKQNGATQIDNVEPGILNSQLKVEKKAVIKLT